MKRNLRKIPEHLIAKLKSMKAGEVVAGCAVKFKADELKSGCIAHLGVTLDKKGLHLSDSIIPPANRGKYSTRNVEGEVIVRKDLPLQTDYNVIDSPNWGDWSNGSHSVNLPFHRYPREFNPPRELSIAVQSRDLRPGLAVYIIAFRVEEVLSKRSTTFKQRLFENLNLLQENVGACGLEPADESIENFAKTLHVTWEILPPGTSEATLKRFFRGRVPTSEERNTAKSRYDFFVSLKPKSLVFGKSGFRRYFGALLEDNLVVFENIAYGNAVYILFERWEELSRRSRIDLLSGKYGTDFSRVVHTTGWKGQVRAIVSAKRPRRAEEQ